VCAYDLVDLLGDAVDAGDCASGVGKRELSASTSDWTVASSFVILSVLFVSSSLVCVGVGVGDEDVCVLVISDCLVCFCDLSLCLVKRV
jgi:hypothetical protein